MGQAVKSDPFAVYAHGRKRIAIRAFQCLFRQLICNSCCVLTPAANRNSNRVAIIVVSLPRVASFARNPGLGNRNSYRVAAAW